MRNFMLRRAPKDGEWGCLFHYIEIRRRGLSWLRYAALDLARGGVFHYQVVCFVDGDEIILFDTTTKVR